MGNVEQERAQGWALLLYSDLPKLIIFTLKPNFFVSLAKVCNVLHHHFPMVVQHLQTSIIFINSL